MGKRFGHHSVGEAYPHPLGSVLPPHAHRRVEEPARLVASTHGQQAGVGRESSVRFLKEVRVTHLREKGIRRMAQRLTNLTPNARAHGVQAGLGQLRIQQTVDPDGVPERLLGQCRAGRCR